MIVFYDPNDRNQVMASYPRRYDGDVWASKGYLQAAVAVDLETELRRHGRDCRVTVEHGVVTRCVARANPVQPVPDPAIAQLQELRVSARDKLLALGLNLSEVEALYGPEKLR